MAGPGTVEPLDYRSYKNLPASAAVRHSRFRLLERRNTNSVPIGKIVRSCAFEIQCPGAFCTTHRLHERCVAWNPVKSRRGSWRVLGRRRGSNPGLSN